MLQALPFGCRKTVRRSVVALCVCFVPFPALSSASAQTTSTIPVLAGQPMFSESTTVAPSGNAKVVVAAASQTTDGVPTARTDVKVPKFSDPLADLAAETLRAMKARGFGSVNVAAPSPTQDGAVVTVSNQVQVVGATVPAPSASAPVVGPGSTNWTSAVINTDSLSDYLFGNAIEVPIAPSTQNILAKLPSDPQVRYSSALRQVSISVANRIKGAKAADLEAVWLRTDDRRMTVILTALAQVGTMYRYTGNQPGGFDCSGLTSYSWSRAGVKIPRVSTEQISAATPRTPADLAVADLIWHPGHIGLYLGVSDYIVHSPQTGKAVEVRTWGKAQRFGTPL